MNEWQRKKELRKKWKQDFQREFLPGHIVEAPPPEAGCSILRGTYTASTGLKIPVEVHCHPQGLIRRLFEEELARRNEVPLKIAQVREISPKELPP